jgi:hypothetical protein
MTTEILVTTTGPLKDALIAQTTTQLAQLRKFSTSYSKHLITSMLFSRYLFLIDTGIDIAT